MQDATKAVREDFVAERAVLAEFETTALSVRRLLLLNLPQHTFGWLPYLLFHTLLLFILYVFLVRVIQGQWGIDDTVAILVAGWGAGAIRLAVHLVLERK
ncbi:hypothetical protein [Bradyrhizobium sp. Leo121]|uniref:hypothetical protein n=1 Tax=Bradyrhizobium sp. Leo121 TaxID=1571195 RepID=UPI001028FADB|nr:hypothetical protein [Bradyrhizobium sp. Leo121]